MPVKLLSLLLKDMVMKLSLFLKQHQKLLQPEGSQLQQPFPSAADFLEAMDKIALCVI